MDPQVKNAIYTAVKTEPFARALKMELVALELGYSHVEMDYDPETMDNIYQRTHGGAIFGLIDEAFETACQTHGTIAVALNVNVTYVASPPSKVRLQAIAQETRYKSHGCRRATDRYLSGLGLPHRQTAALAIKSRYDFI